jgi:hypothetical protein
MGTLLMDTCGGYLNLIYIGLADTVGPLITSSIRILLRSQLEQPHPIFNDYLGPCFFQGSDS